jgi:hypothetical protein
MAFLYTITVRESVFHVLQYGHFTVNAPIVYLPTDITVIANKRMNVMNNFKIDNVITWYKEMPTKAKFV